MTRCVRYVLMLVMAMLSVPSVGAPLRAQQVVTGQANPDGTPSAEALLARRITVTLNNVSLKRAIDSVASAAKVVVQYRLPVINAHTTPVSVHAVGTALGIALEQVLQGTALRVVPDQRGHLLIEEAPDASVRADSVRDVGTVTGRVLDSVTGRGVTGATVKVAGTKIGTMTQDSGRFVLRNVPAGHQVLTTKIFGYRPANQAVTVISAQSVVIRIPLTSVPNVLSGVVTTAAGVQRKVEIGNDITTINADSVMQHAPVSSVTDLLETRVPGLTITRSSGVPGSPSRLRLRGVSSIGGPKDPIVVVDGVRVYAAQSDPRNANLAPTSGRGIGGGNQGTSAYAAPSPLDQIDPNTIETVEVFKGPSATAIYGSDAANGVIVITTKKGRAGPTLWSLNGGIGMSTEPGQWPVNYYRFGSSLQTPFVPQCAWNDLTCHVDSVVGFQALNDDRYKLFDTGWDQTLASTVSGGSSSLQYSLTGSAAQNLGILKLPAIEETRFQKFYGMPAPGWMRRPLNYRTWGATGQLVAAPNPAVQVMLTSNWFNSRQQQSSLESAILQLEGEYIDPTQLANTPLIQNDVERALDQSISTTNAATINWRALPWLPLTATGGINTIDRTDESYIPYGISSGGPGTSNGDTTGSYGIGRGTSQDKTLSLGTSMSLPGVTLAVGGNWHNATTADLHAYTNQLAPGISEPSAFPSCENMTNCQQSTSQSTTRFSTYGWYVQPTLNVNSRFFVSPGFRLDGGSASGSHAGLTGFPKIDLSWIAVDRQEGAPLFGVVTQLRPRVAFGYAGIQPNPADKLRLFNANANNGPHVVSIDGATFLPDVSLSTLGNTQLHPERDGELEGGFDANLWNGRLQLTYTQYTKTAHDAIIAIPVAVSASGDIANSQSVNIGVIRNAGQEATVNMQLWDQRAFSWNVQANFSHNSNRVIRLNPGFDPLYSIGIVPGFPLFGRWVRPIVGFADANGNGIIDTSEVRLGDSLVSVGQQTPKYELNLTSGMTVFNGRVSVNATFAYQHDLTQLNEGAGTSGGFQNIANAPGTSLATQAALVAFTGCTVFCAGSAGSNIGLIQTMNVFRFDALSVSFTPPRRVSDMIRVPLRTIAVQGSNLALHTSYRGKDPNVNAFSTSTLGSDFTADLGQIPQPRTWWLKLTVGN